MTMARVPHQTVRDALAVARLLDGRPGLSHADRVLVLAAPHLPRPDPRPSADIAGPEDGRRERLADAIAPAVQRVFLPALHDRLVAVLRGEEDGPDAASLAQALSTLRDLATPPRLRSRARLSPELAAAVRARADACVESVRTALQGDDFPDVSALSNDLLRLEALRWIVDLLGDAGEGEAIAYRSRRLARITLSRAAATIGRFLQARDMMSLFDNAAVIAQVDNLIVVAGRVLDARAAGEEERTAFVETADQQALLDFIDALAQLSDALFAMTGKAAQRADANDVFFRSLIRQIECLARFCRHLHHGLRPSRLDVIEAGVTRRLAALAERMAAALDRAAADGADHGPAMLARAEDLRGVLVRLGADAAAEPLDRSIRAARRTMHPG